MNKGIKFYTTMSVGIIGALLYTLPSLSRGAFAAHLDTNWYPKKRANLQEDLQKLSTQASARYDLQIEGNTIRAVVVPHAGYTYSGIVAAAAYRIVDAASIDRVVILAPSHSVYFRGVALAHFDAYEIPTGSLIVTPTPEVVQTKGLFHEQQDAFRREHALEIQLPLVKFFFPKATIVPFIIGELDAADIDVVARQLAKVITPTTLVVISSDMTHYGTRFSYTPFLDNVITRIRQLDGRVLNALQQQSYAELMDVYQQTKVTVCGITPLAVLMKLIEHGVFGAVTTRLVAYATSEEVAHDLTGIVSYASLVVARASHKRMLSMYEKEMLLQYAHDILKHSFDSSKKNDVVQPIMTPLLNENRAVFVTLYDTNGGKKELRGCIGTTVATKPLYQNVADMTRAAAFHDARFAPVKQEELAHMMLEISVLEQPKSVASYRDIVLGKHGIILTVGQSSALFLPQVASEFGWTLEQTLEQLSRKAGLSADAWKKPEAKFQVFETVNFEKLLH